MPRKIISNKAAAINTSADYTPLTAPPIPKTVTRIGVPAGYKLSGSTLSRASEGYGAYNAEGINYTRDDLYTSAMDLASTMGEDAWVELSPDGGITVRRTPHNRWIRDLMLAAAAAMGGYALTAGALAPGAAGAETGAGSALPADLLSLSGGPLTTAQMGTLAASGGAPVIGAGATGITVGGAALPASTVGAITTGTAASTLGESLLLGANPIVSGGGMLPVIGTGGAGAITTTGGNGILNSATRVVDYLKEHPSSVKTIAEQLMPGNNGASADDWAALDEAERVRLEEEEAARNGNRQISGVSMRTGNPGPLTYRGSNQPVYTNGILNRRTGS